MRRRQLLAATGCLTAAASARAGTTRAVLRIGLSNPIAAVSSVAATAFADQVRRTVGDRIRFEIYAAGEAGGELEITEDVQSGALEMACVSSAGYTVLDPALGVFDIPFLFRDPAHARAVLDGPIGQAALSRTAPRGVVGLGWVELGVRHLTTFDKPVRSPRDLAGMVLRVPQSAVMLASFKALGADARTLPFPELYAALAARTFQAEENPLGNIVSSNLDRVQRYVSLTGHVYAAAMLIINQRAFDRLEPADQQALRDALPAGAKASRDGSDRNEASGIAELRRRGMTVVTDIDRAAFVAALSILSPDFERTFGKDQISAIRAFGT